MKKIPEFHLICGGQQKFIVHWAEGDLKWRVFASVKVLELENMSFLITGRENFLKWNMYGIVDLYMKSTRQEPKQGIGAEKYFATSLPKNLQLGHDGTKPVPHEEELLFKICKLAMVHCLYSVIKNNNFNYISQSFFGG